MGKLHNEWSSEMPTESGYYWVNNDRINLLRPELVEVQVEGDVFRLRDYDACVVNPFYRQTVEFFQGIQWLKADVPTLPKFELVPCPICGKVPIIATGTLSKRFYLRCEGNNPVDHTIITNTHATEEAAIQEWNQRVGGETLDGWTKGSSPELDGYYWVILKDSSRIGRRMAMVGSRGKIGVWREVLVEGSNYIAKENVMFHRAISIPSINVLPQSSEKAASEPEGFSEECK